MRENENQIGSTMEPIARLMKMTYPKNFKGRDSVSLVCSLLYPSAMPERVSGTEVVPSDVYWMNVKHPATGFTSLDTVSRPCISLSSPYSHLWWPCTEWLMWLFLIGRSKKVCFTITKVPIFWDVHEILQRTNID